MSDIGESFDEDQFSLDVIKYDYAEEFVEMLSLCDCLKNDGYEWRVEISMDVAADYPMRVVEKIETKEIYPTVKVEGVDGPTTISYLPVDSTSFQIEGEDSDLANLIADCL